MYFLKSALLIILAVLVTRLIPHPPNFTSLIAMSFYIPAFFGTLYIPIILFSFFISDLFFGFHQTLFFTWGSIVFIGFIAKYFSNNLKVRFSGLLISSFIFYIVSNFGVWLTGSYSFTAEGMLECYILAIPFFKNSLFAAMFYGLIFEFLYKFLKPKKINYINQI